MIRIINLILKFKEYFTFAALVIVSLILISGGNVSQIGGLRAVIIGITGKIQSTFSWIPNPAALKSENRAIRELNLQLSAEVTRSREVVGENKRLRSMLAFVESSGYSLAAAEIVGKSSLELRNYVTINKGSIQSIMPGMIVRTDAGLVGSVVLTSNNYSLVELIKNRNVKISAIVQRNQLEGIIVWEAGSNLLMKNIPKSFDIRSGDQVLTSSYSNKYPEDIPIGEVVGITDEGGSMFLRVDINPNVDFNTLEQVFVVHLLPDPERAKLVEEMEQRLMSRKSKP